MYSEWEILELGELVKLNYGKSLTASNRVPGNVPVYSSAGITGFHNKSLISSKGIIVGRKGSIGTVFKTSIPFYPIDTVYYILPNDKRYDFDFLYYLLKNIGLENLNEDSAVPGLNRNTAYSQIISLPPIVEQKHISKILSTLDNKIELNKKINQTLESIAQTIFKSWFVDFDPVHAKANAKSEDEYDAIAKELGISREILDLFPSEFEESDLGLIPKGWSHTTLEEDFDILMGQSPKSSSYNEEGRGVLFFQGNADFNFRFPTKRVYSTEPKKIAQPGQTLISVRAPVGDINMADQYCAIGRGLCAVSHKKNLNSYTYYLMLNLKKEFKNFENNGTVFGSISKQNLKNIFYLKPIQILSTTFEDFIKHIDKQIFLYTKNMNSLCLFRDLLLPKLLSGEIDVSNLNLEHDND